MHIIVILYKWKGLYDDDDKVMKHLFINQIEKAKIKLNVTDIMFHTWIKEVSDGFDCNNYWALERNIDPTMDGVNPRCVLAQLENAQELSRQTNIEVRNLKRKLASVETELQKVFKTEKTKMN